MPRHLLCLFMLWLSLHSPAVAQDTPATRADHVGSSACADCHRDAAEAWETSHHALAWTAPSPDSILADFDGTEYRHDGVLYRFTREDGRYKIGLTEASGATKEYEVHSVAGIAPLQQYLVETEPGRIQSFDVVWDVEEARWYHLYPDQTLPPDDGLHWTGPYKNWNARCAECHATGFDKNFDAMSDTYASTQAEIGVGCEACHGPGSAHVAWAEQWGDGAGNPLPPPPGYGFSLDFATAGTEAMIQQCATCHSRREPLDDGNPVPGMPYHDAYGLALLRPGLYHADGQILDEVYVYGSFLQSKMYARGVGCLDCHEAHTAELKVEGNGLCTQCHSASGNPEFPTLSLKTYDDPAHHFHPAGSEGAQCRNCHMIERTYMGIDGRRDHSFRIPRPDLAPVTGAPDACTDCHADRTADWAAAEIAKRYPEAAARPHYGVTLAAGRMDPAGAAPRLVSLARDEGEAALVRATSLWLLSQAADETAAEESVPFLQDESPLVRAAAIAVQRGAPDQVRVQRLIELLGDPVRTVRIEAAKALLNAPIARLPQRYDIQLQQAMGEWRESLQARIDYPETHLVLGGMALSMRNIPAANGAFREVVRMDPQREDAWVMLIRIAAASAGRDATIQLLDEAQAAMPDSAALQDMRRSISQP